MKVWLKAEALGTKEEILTHCGEVNCHRQDNKGHDPEDSLHSSQIGVVDTRFSSQLKKFIKIGDKLKNK